MLAPTRTWTPEQETIFDLANASENIMIDALAGTGKSYVLKCLQEISKSKPVLYLVFNTDNALKAMSHAQLDQERKKPKPEHKDEDRMLSTTIVRTFNSMGHRVWGATGRTVKFDSKKTSTQLRQLIDESPKPVRNQLWSVWDQVVSGVGLAKSVGYIPSGLARSDASLITESRFHAQLDESPDDLVADLINSILRTSIKLSYDGVIDYNDQVYMPALFGGTFPKFPQVMVDEYQDLSPVNHTLLTRLVTKRVIGVGDPWQNIYGFRGAHATGMEDARKSYGMKSLNLSVSFRCPEAIVRHVHWRVPHFKWSNLGGHVDVVDKMDANLIPDNAVVICRNNAPLFAMAFRLIGIGHSVSVAGSDIGPRLVGQMKRLGSDTMSRAQTLSAINDWEDEKLANESKTAKDMAECMRIFARQGDSLSQAIAFAEHLFKQDGSIKLMTGHKSKGLEFDHVIHLDPWLCSDSEQDQNLRYVISTRSRDRLVEIDSLRIEW